MEGKNNHHEECKETRHQRSRNVRRAAVTRKYRELQLKRFSSGWSISQPELDENNGMCNSA
jgi:hypothetical protein